MSKLALLFFGAAGGLLVAGAIVLAIALTRTEAPTPTTQAPPTEALPTAVAPTSTPAPPSTAPIVRLRVPRINVDANVVVLGVDPDGTMQAPKNPRDVGWYRFSARPDAGGNIVMTGHLDYVNYGPAVFWRLRELREGDEVDVDIADGSTFRYRVEDVSAYDADAAPVAEIVGQTHGETLTLITCAGVFQSSVREYEKRLIVRAVRV